MCRKQTNKNFKKTIARKNDDRPKTTGEFGNFKIFWQQFNK